MMLLNTEEANMLPVLMLDAKARKFTNLYLLSEIHLILF